MKERPILFSGEMVRAILDGRKTQTRRAMKPQPANGWSFETAEGVPMRLGRITSPHPKKGRFGIFIRHEIHPGSGKFEHDIIPCPYGQPGDRLWVRETWGIVQMRHLISATPGAIDDAVTYRAGRLMLRSEDRPDSGSFDEWPSTWSEDYAPSDGRWRPSIHMPRWASRILLEVTDVRVERLQEISEADAWAEGCQEWMGKETPWKGHLAPVSVHGYAALWESINDPGSWAANPWVWVMEFKRVEQERQAA